MSKSISMIKLITTKIPIYTKYLEELNMTQLVEVNEIIKTLKAARDILKQEYSESEFHKKKEAHPHSIVPPSPEDEEILKLLTAIQQLELYIKKFQDEQFELLKKQEET